MKPLAWIALLGMTSALAIASCNNNQNPAQQYGNTFVQPLKSAMPSFRVSRFPAKTLSLILFKDIEIL